MYKQYTQYTTLHTLDVFFSNLFFNDEVKLKYKLN